MTETDTNINTNININCSICTDNLEIQSKRCCIKNNIPIKTLECNHQYHTDCIDTWLKNHNTCPLCRKEVKKVSGIYISSNERNLERNVERNNFINKIKNNKKDILCFILYILFLSGAIAHIITLSSTLNYINEFNNTNSSNVFHKKRIINNFIVIGVYIAFLSILLFLNIQFRNKKWFPVSFFAGPSIIITLTLCYVYYNVVNNNNITDYIKSLNDTNNINDKKMNNYIINKNLIILMYNSIASSFYVLFTHCIFEISKFF